MTASDYTDSTLERLRNGVRDGWLREQWFRVVAVTADVYHGEMREAYLQRALRYALADVRRVQCQRERARSALR